MHRNQSKSTKLVVEEEVELVQRPSAPSEYTLTKDFPSENYRNLESNGKLYTSVWPQKLILLTSREQDELKDAPWFQAGLARKISLEILLQQIPGSFLVRQSESHKKCFALSMRVAPLVPPKLSHYLIEKTHSGYRFKGQSKEFTTLKSLVIHHSVLKEHLPTTLILPRAHDRLILKLFYDDKKESENENLKSPTTLCFSRKSKET